ncbi:MAG: hypothetical protein M1825_001964 [Sarcosagium campestre]|nr:MAG: hypothetical protein M1825_001964 [Sarcosagium campestre]
MPPKRMTANPVKPARYRPGKPVAVKASSSSEEEDDGDEEPNNEAKDVSRQSKSAPPPKATSFPTDPTKIATNLKKVDLNERRRQGDAQEAARLKAESLERAKAEEGFVTEESEAENSGDEEGASSSGEDEDEDEDDSESSEEDEPKRVLLRPTFIKKDKRQASLATAEVNPEEEERKKAAEREQAANALVEEQLRKVAEARAAERSQWDDEEVGNSEDVDDTDGLDPEAERAAWKLRELRRVKREREAIEQAEQEREEIERRRNLSAADRDAEDRDFIAKQKEEKDGRGNMAFMQRYLHKGAFFQDDAKQQGLDRRDIMGSRFQDDVTNRELLPEYMQIRDMTKLGRKGRTKYRDLKSEDTGRWGQFDDRRPPRDGGDERFRADDRFKADAAPGATGANASVVGQRRAPVEGAPAAPKAMRDGGGDDGGMKPVDKESALGRGGRVEDDAYEVRFRRDDPRDGQRQRRPRRDSDIDDDDDARPADSSRPRRRRRRSISSSSRRSTSRSPGWYNSRGDRRGDYRDERRDRDRSRDRRGDRDRDRDKDRYRYRDRDRDRDRRKRSRSPYRDRHDYDDKRRRIDTR